MQRVEAAMISSSSSSKVVGAKTGRACDNCIWKGARWYCAADDAFLCQSCDSQVHSANPLARRHQRVRLTMIKSQNHEVVSPSWHRRKARTPRHKKLLLVPQISANEEIENENDHDDQQLYRVPELCTTTSNDPDMDFAATFLGKAGLDDDDMEGLGILDQERNMNSWSERVLKDEDDHEEEEDGVNSQFIGLATTDTNFELNFDYDSPIMGMDELMELDDEAKNVAKEDLEKVIDDGGNKINLLRLDYEGVMSAWDDHKSPWMTGKRPHHCWPHCIGTCGTTMQHVYGGEMGMMSGHAVAMADGGGGREARVLRYREKRRTRLFSKKIRYEVRKLNAEKRPRIKGRFVKRANLAEAAAYSVLSK